MCSSDLLAEVPAGATVLDLGCGPGHLCPALRERGCRVIGVDQFRPTAGAGDFDEFHLTDLNRDPLPRDLGDVQVVLVLDIIEHLISPEAFCDTLRRRAQENPGIRIVISTGNVGFLVTRLMLLLGQFNYNKRGILDLTHTRLFTFSSLRRLLKETGFVIERSLDGINFTQIGSVGVNISTFSASSLTRNTWYYFRVRAFNAAGYSSYSNVAKGKTAR